MKTPKQLKESEERKRWIEKEMHRSKVLKDLETRLNDSIAEGIVTSTGGRISLGGWYNKDDVRLMKGYLIQHGWNSCVEAETVYGYSMTCRSETESTHYYLRLKPRKR